MKIWAVTATLICIIVLIMFMAYRRQVKNTCRHLAFRKKNKTNLRMLSQLPFSELNQLAYDINELLDETDELKRNTIREHNNLKSAITSISHDIRTPLTSMDGYFQLMKRAESDQERQQYIEVIRRRIDSLKNMLEELFTYTKIQNDGYTFDIEKLDLKKCLVDTMISFYEEFNKRQVQPIVDVCDEDVHINANEEAVKRIIQNLVKNVLEHSEDDVKISLNVKEDKVIMIVENVVRNADEIDIGKVFTHFYKADSSRTQSSTGLGLAIAKGLTEKMGGDISAELDGTWFKIKVVLNKLT